MKDTIHTFAIKSRALGCSLVHSDAPVPLWTNWEREILESDTKTHDSNTHPAAIEQLNTLAIFRSKITASIKCIQHLGAQSCRVKLALATDQHQRSNPRTEEAESFDQVYKRRAITNHATQLEFLWQKPALVCDIWYHFTITPSSSRYLKASRQPDVLLIITTRFNSALRNTPASQQLSQVNRVHEVAVDSARSQDAKDVIYASYFSFICERHKRHPSKGSLKDSKSK